MASYRTLLFFLTLSLLTLTARASPSAQAEQQILVFLKPGYSFHNFRKQLPSEVTVLVHEMNLCILHADTAVTPELLAAVRKLPAVKSAQMDQRVKSQFGSKNKNPADCAPLSSDPDSNVDAEDAASMTRFIEDSTRCSVNEVCANTKSEKLWAQNRLDADLMNAYVKEHQLATKKPVPVIVLDSGFDAAQMTNMMAGANLKVEPGVFGVGAKPDAPDALQDGASLVGDPKHDVEGHGTMVASVIGAKGGIGIAPDAQLSVLRVSADDSGTAPQSFIMAAIHRACRKAKEVDPSSTPVINSSWASRGDEMGDRTLDISKEVQDYLSQQGCLLVKAAGNSSFRSNDSAVNGTQLDGPVLRVAATDPFGRLSNFSSSGEVTAPGQQVLVLESTQATVKATDSQRCNDGSSTGGVSSRFVNGTSFSSPLTAGLASEVISVLRNGAKFDSLSAQNRIALVNRIIAASQSDGSVNALRAVMIADRWNQSAGSDLLPVQKLSALLNQPVDPACAVVQKKCANQNSCSSVKACFLQERFRLSVCPNISSVEIQDNFDTAIAAGAMETASFDYMQLLAKGIDVKTQLAAQNKIIDSYIRQWGLQFNAEIDDSSAETLIDTPAMDTISSLNLTSGFAEKILLPYLKNSGSPATDSSKKAQFLLDNYLKGFVVPGELDRGPNRGAEDTLDLVTNLLLTDKAKLGQTAFHAHLQAMFDAYHEELKNNPSVWTEDKIVTLLRIIGELKKDPRFAEEVPLAVNEENRLWNELDRYDVNTGKSTPKIVTAGMEVPEDRAFVYALISAHEDELKQQILHSDLAKLSGIKLMFVLEHIGDFAQNPPEQVALANRLNTQIKAKQSVYRFSSDAAAVKVINSALGSANVNDQIAILDSTTDLDVLRQIFAPYQWHSTTGKQAPLPDDALSRTRLRLASGLFDAYEKDKSPTSLAVIDMVGLATFDELKKGGALLSQWLLKSLDTITTDPAHSLPLLEKLLADGKSLSCIDSSDPVFVKLDALMAEVVSGKSSLPSTLQNSLKDWHKTVAPYRTP